MPSAWQPGQLLFAGFEGTQVPGDLARLISEGRVGGVVLFARNLRDPHQVRELTTALRSHAPEDVPLVIAIDQEGGRVQRLRQPWTEWPPMRDVGRVGDVAVTAEVAKGLARELLEIGVTLDFAPVVDVDTNPDNPVIGDRSFSRDPAEVCRHAKTFIAAMQSGKVAACAKHFPGHGDTSTDSHLQLPRLDHDLERLKAVELAPFCAAVEAGVASIMTAHVLFPRLDTRRPATLAPAIMALLREELGYDGLVFSDDLEMRAVADHYRPGQLVDGCLGAGVDSLLVCRMADLRDEILRLLERAPDRLVERALQRMNAFKTEFANVPASEPTGPPYPAHQRLAADVISGN